MKKVFNSITIIKRMRIVENSMKKHREVISAIAYTFSSIFSRGLSIITVPIFTRLMSPGQIGVVSLYNSWHATISSVATLSLTSGGLAVALKEYDNEKDKYISSVLSLTSLVSIFITIIYCCFSSFWNKCTGLSTPLMILIMVGLLISPATDFWIAKQRYDFKWKLSTIVSVGSALVASLLSIIAVKISADKGYENNLGTIRLFANYAVLYLVALVIWICIMVKGRCFVNKTYWKLSLSLSIPLIGYSLASNVLGVSDRMVIKWFFDDSAVGIYSTLYSISSLFTMVWTAVNASFVPYLYRNIGTNNMGIKNITSKIFLVYSVFGIFTVYLGPEVIRIVATEEYLEGLYLMPAIAAGVFFISLGNMYSNILMYIRSSIFVMISAVIGAVLNLITNILFIPMFGYVAAAYTTLGSYLIMAGLLYLFARIKYKKFTGESISSVYNNKFLLVLSLFSVLFMLFANFLYSFTKIRLIIVGILIVLLIGVAIRYIYIIRKTNNK